MIIGKEITIMGSTWKIELVPEVRDPEGHKCFGETDHSLLTIRIDETNIEQQKFQSLCHEITHAILHQLGYHFNEEMKHDERFVEQFSGILCQVIPQIAEWQVNPTMDYIQTVSEAEYKNEGLEELKCSPKVKSSDTKETFTE